LPAENLQPEPAEYLGTCEKINSQNFNYPEYGVIEQESGVNRFIMSVGQWIGRTQAIGMNMKYNIFYCPNN
jgi:hypothetical protein